ASSGCRPWKASLLWCVSRVAREICARWRWGFSRQLDPGSSFESDLVRASRTFLIQQKGRGDAGRRHASNRSDFPIGSGGAERNEALRSWLQKHTRRPFPWRVSARESDGPSTIG